MTSGRQRRKSKAKAIGKKSARRGPNAIYLRIPDLTDPQVCRPTLEDFPEESRLIALIISEWSAIEAKLIGITSMSVMNGGLVDCMLASVQGSRNRLNTIQAALDFAGAFESPFRGELTEIMSDAGTLLGKRNILAHAIYGHQMKTKVKRLVIVDSKRNSDPITIKRLKSDLEQMVTLSHRVGMVLTFILQSTDRLHLLKKL